VTPDLDPAATTRSAPAPTTPPNPLLLLGEDDLDGDHQRLLVQARAVIESDNVALPTCFRTLRVHTEQHFDREHELMAKYGYRGMRDHKAEHARLLREFDRFVEHVDRGCIEFGRTFVLERLLPWLEVHVSSMDCALVLHVQKKLEAVR